MSRELEFIDNLINVNRYPSDTLIKSESVSDHVWCMIGLALEYVPKLNKKFDPTSFDLEHIITLIALHDIDESLYCDIPRKFKYENEELRAAIHNTAERLLKDRVPHETFTLIQQSTDKSTPSGVLVKIFDIAQSGYKMLSEIKLGNSNFISEINNALDCLEGMKDKIRESEFLECVERSLLWLCDEFQSDINEELGNVKGIL